MTPWAACTLHRPLLLIHTQENSPSGPTEAALSEPPTGMGILESSRPMQFFMMLQRLRL